MTTKTITPSTHKAKESRAIIYTRVSTLGQAEKGTSLEEQLKAGISKAAAMGAQVIAHEEDAGISGAYYATRHGLQAALTRIESGEANALIIANFSRYSRDLEHQSAIKKRVENVGGRLIFCDMDFADTPEGDLAFGIMGSFAEYERKQIRERTMKGRRARAEQGQQVARSQNPYGYRIVTKALVVRGEYPEEALGTYQIIEEEARWVREAYDRYTAGETLWGIANWLQNAGVPTARKAREWEAETVRRILMNPVHCGKPTFGKVERKTDESRLQKGFKNVAFTKPALAENVVTLSAPPIVSEEVWARCQERFAENKALFSGRSDRRWLLTGMLRCPNCERNMKGQIRKSKKDGKAYYSCRFHAPSQSTSGFVCNPVRHFSELLEGAIIGMVQQLADTPESVTAAFNALTQRESAAPSDNERQKIEAELAALKIRERKVCEAQVESIGGQGRRDLYQEMLAEIDDERERLNKRLSALGQQEKPQSAAAVHAEAKALLSCLTAVAGEVLTATELTLPEKHSLLTRLIKTIFPCCDKEGRDALRVELHGVVTYTVICVSSV